MFNNCIALAEAPELPATELASYCYCGMFFACTSLTKAPELPATELASYCYYQMFRSCNNLSYVTMLCDKNNIDNYFSDWLTYAGFGVQSRTLTVKDREAYNLIESTLPYCWKIGYPNTTVKDENGNVLTY